MENIVLDVNPQPSKRGKMVQRILFLIMGLGNIYQGFSMPNWFRYMNLSFGVVCILFALYLHRLYRSKEYLFTSEGIEGPKDSNNSVKIGWSEISLVEMKMYSMRIFLKGGKTYKLNLSNLTFEQHKNIKPKIEELIKAKGIEVNAG